MEGGAIGWGEVRGEVRDGVKMGRGEWDGEKWDKEGQVGRGWKMEKRRM